MVSASSVVGGIEWVQACLESEHSQGVLKAHYPWELAGRGQDAHWVAMELERVGVAA